MIGTKELRAQAADARHRGDEEFAAFVDSLAQRRERDYDERQLAPLLYRELPVLTGGRPFNELPLDEQSGLVEAATALREFLESHGWQRPDEPGRRWQHTADVPPGTRFESLSDRGMIFHRGEEGATGPAGFADSGKWRLYDLDEEYGSRGYIEVLA
ncbi:hypothetical protein [Nocardia wallacei]|uniref:hypothetical protein n=1 Tax=Nocardia wallacei TaxID=480035 RepID=UPI002457E336|nr:hypothetical protein [Nocardia wallacei]